MSKAAELAALIGSQSSLSNKNLIINGAMQVAQRGTSQTGITSDGYKQAPDRFNFNVNGAGTWTASQSTTAPEGFANSYKLECTVADASLAASDVIRFRYRMEGQDLQHLKKGTSNAESVTLSFYVRSSKTGTYTVELNDADNTRHIVKSYTITSADTWQFVSLTYAGDTTGAFDNDNALSLSVMFCLAAGSNFTSGTLATSWASITSANRSVGQVNLADTVGNTFYLTGVQLEVGEQATPFEHRSFADELLRCARYCYRWESENTNSYLCVGFLRTNTQSRYSLPSPVPLRSGLDADLTLTSSGTWAVLEQGTSQTVTSFDVASSFKGVLSFFANVASGFATGDACQLRANSSGSYLQIEAEL